MQLAFLQSDGGHAAVSPVTKSPRTRAEPGTRMSVLLSNPDYLLEGFAEKRCKVRAPSRYATINLSTLLLQIHYTLSFVLVSLLEIISALHYTFSGSLIPDTSLYKMAP